MYIKEGLQDLIRIKQTESRKEYLRLDMNENPNGLPEEFIKDVLESIKPEDIAMYPEAYALIELLASYNEVEKENISIVNGTDEGIKSIFEALSCSGKEVVGVYPTFEMYNVYAKMYNLKFRQIAYDENLSVSSGEILDNITDNTAIVILLNPNNPIGTVWSYNEADKIVQKAWEKGALVIIDEAYYYYYNKTFLQLAKEYNNVILLRTFSKLCSMAGCRIGYMLGDSRLIELVDKVRPSAGINIFGLKFAEAVIANQELIDSLSRKEKEGKEFLYKELRKLGYAIFYGEGNYVLFKPKHSPQVLYEKMKKRGILIKIYNQKVLSEYVRITTADEGTMRQFIECLVQEDKI